MGGRYMTGPQGLLDRPKEAKPAPPARPYPFPVGVYDSGTQDYDISLVQLATPQQFQVWNISPTGWLRGLWLSFTLTTAGNAATVVFNADPTGGGFAGVQKVIVYDLGGEQVIALGGYEWMVMNKFGGYFEVGDPRADLTFTQTAGAGATGGSEHLMLYLPFEAVARDGLGTVQNESKPGRHGDVPFRDVLEQRSMGAGGHRVHENLTLFKPGVYWHDETRRKIMDTGGPGFCVS